MVVSIYKIFMAHGGYLEILQTTSEPKRGLSWSVGATWRFMQYKTKCKTCKILIKETQFTSGLTNKTYHTRSWDDLSCKSSNVVYGVAFSLCGLIYVGEMKGQLRNRMSGHRYEINHGSNQLLYQHFNLPDHSILSFKVRILEKIYHPTNNPSLSTPLRRQREEFWHCSTIWLQW